MPTLKLVAAPVDWSAIVAARNARRALMPKGVKGVVAPPGVTLAAPPPAGQEKSWLQSLRDDVSDAIDTLGKWAVSDVSPDYQKKMAAKDAVAKELGQSQPAAAKYGLAKDWEDLTNKAKALGAAASQAVSTYASGLWILVLLWAWSESSKRGW